MSLISEEALDAHCRRVAGWAKQAAHKLQCSAEELQALERAAMLHHAENLVLRPKAFAAIAGDLRVQIAEGPPGSGPYSGMTLEILQAYNSPVAAPPRPAELAKILEWADQFDEQFELSAIDPLPPDEFAAETSRLQITEASEVLRVGQKLPVFPTVAQKAMRLLASEDFRLEELERIVRSDQAMAAELLKVANSSLMGQRKSITSLAQAVQHVGVNASVRVICAACLRPIFASRKLFDLWNHSIDAAETAERLALVSERVDPGEAFLAGLVHDIGRLAFSLLSGDFQVTAQCLLEHRCPTVLVERALSGTNHAEVGSELLRSWRIPSPIPDAVSCHHDLGESAIPLAAILYLTEFSTMADEDLPSFLRLDRALHILDLPRQFVLSPHPRNSPSLAWLKLASRIN
ncbi:MAG: HDOD domain-containing protein [Bryobacteraceae bacterium]|jgi:putative nucleotidyltransferase with HDIG domain